MLPRVAQERVAGLFWEAGCRMFVHIDISIYLYIHHTVLLLLLVCPAPQDRWAQRQRSGQLRRELTACCTRG